MSDVTQILSQIEEGDSQAAERLLPLVYDELIVDLTRRRRRVPPEYGENLQLDLYDAD